MRRTLLAASCLFALSLATPTHAANLPRKAALGVGLSAVTPELQEKYGLGAGEGVTLTQIAPGQSAEQAGLKVGDIVLTLDDKPVTPQTLAPALAPLPVGARPRLKVLRAGKPQTIIVTLLERPRDPGTADYTVEYSDVVSNGNRMRTLISHPRTPGKHPALFFIQGYSPISYDYRLDAPGLDAPILYEFARTGFVTLRVDKPGVGDSEGGPFADVDFTTELDIYRQALMQLKSQPDVDTTNVFIFGHSMGGAFGPMVAAESPVKGAVMYGIATRTWHEYLLDTQRYQNLLAGASYAEVDDQVRRAGRVMEMIFQDHLEPEQVKQAHPDLAATVDDVFPGGLFSQKTARFWEQLEDTNFASYWERCHTRVLAIHGASDFVSYMVDHQLTADIVNRAHPGWGEALSLPDSDHIFSNWPTEAESQQHFPKGDFNPAIVGVMTKWVAERMKG